MSIIKMDLNSLIDIFFKNKLYEIPTDVCHIMKSYGSDKGLGWHNYTILYAMIFDHLREANINIFEMGIGTNFIDIPSNMGIDGKPGSSLFAWREIFPNAKIYGADIDNRILFSSDRIETFFCDQTNQESIRQLLTNDQLKDIEFDIMIDDGLHTFEANYTLLINSIHKLKKGGYYIIESINKDRLLLTNSIINRLKQQLSLQYIKLLSIPSEYNNSDNNILLIQK